MSVRPTPLKFRKYGNRKYYDLTLARTSTLREIAVLLKHGNEVVIEDHKTKNDITRQVLVTLLTGYPRLLGEELYMSLAKRLFEGAVAA